jgi:thiol:disulfide interchange protein
VRLGTLTAGIVAVVLAAGCSGGGAAAPAPSATSTAPTPIATRSAPVATVRPVPSLTPPPPSATSPAESASLYDPNADARADIAGALKAAKADGKRVLLDFGADWCPDCHVLAAYMDGSAGRALIEPAFHVVRIDVGLFDHNLDIVQEYFDMQGIPEVVVLDATGKVVGSSADTVSLANARGMTEKQVLDELRAWAK